MNTAIALTCAWLTVPGALPPNTAPLTFGMTPQDVANALGAPLVHVSGKPGAEIFYAARSAGIPGFYRADERLYLQFRKGCLTGWKKGWQMAPRGLF